MALIDSVNQISSMFQLEELTVTFNEHNGCHVAEWTKDGNAGTFYYVNTRPLERFFPTLIKALIDWRNYCAKYL